MACAEPLAEQNLLQTSISHSMRRAADPKQTQEATIAILLTLFPSWLPSFFSVMFARPFPEFSNQMNAWVTALTCQWLMGPNEVTDYERPDGTIAKAQAVQVERCGPLAHCLWHLRAGPCL